MEGMSSVAGGGAGAGAGMSPCTLSQRGQASQRVAAANSCNTTLGSRAAGQAGGERPPAKHSEGAKT